MPTSSANASGAMPDDLCAEFFAWFDQQPRTPTGVLVPGPHGEMRIHPAALAFAEWRSQLRGRVPQPARCPRFPELERRRHQLPILAQMLAKEQ